MPQDIALTRPQLKTPKAAAIAGIAFSVLLIGILAMFRSAVPADPLESGAWLVTDSNKAAIALNLIPFAGAAFLWFIGVLRDRLGSREDRFFATVFLGSGLLFLAMLFVSATIMGGLVLVFNSSPANDFFNSPTFRLARATTFIIMNVYAVKMAAVFMFSTSVVVIKTAIAPRWIAIAGMVLAVFLLVGSYSVSWSVIVLPLWVLLISGYILVDNMSMSEERLSS
jgi:hypothetical protein